MDTMKTNDKTPQGLAPAGRMPDGGVRFYGWAPDPENRKQRLSVHERNRADGTGSDDLLDCWFDTFEEAEAFVTEINMAAATPEEYRT